MTDKLVAMLWRSKEVLNAGLIAIGIGEFLVFTVNGGDLEFTFSKEKVLSIPEYITPVSDGFLFNGRALRSDDTHEQITHLTFIRERLFLFRFKLCPI